MSIKMVDVTIHIDENTTHEQREGIRDQVLNKSGVEAATYHDDKPHLLVVEYNPDDVNSTDLLQVVQNSGVHAELIGL
jgi:hypothetical protein